MVPSSSHWVARRTTCVRFDADAFAIQNALEGLTDVYDVSVRQPPGRYNEQVCTARLRRVLDPFRRRVPSLGPGPRFTRMPPTGSYPCGYWMNAPTSQSFMPKDVAVTVTPLLEEMPCSAGNTSAGHRSRSDIPTWWFFLCHCRWEDYFNLP